MVLGIAVPAGNRISLWGLTEYGRSTPSSRRHVASATRN